MTVRLIQCNEFGDPEEDLGTLPRALVENCKATAELFASIGFAPPWVGYITIDNDSPVGGCAFVGAPQNGSVEIAYFTLDEFAGLGYATQATARLIEIARRTDPTLSLRAKTLPEENASTSILKRNGFQFAGETSDEEIGLAWEWLLQKNETTE